MLLLLAMRSAFWSAESEALHSAEHYGPLKTRLYHRAKHYGPLKRRWQNLKFLYLSFIFRRAYLKDSNAAAHSVDSGIFQSSDSSICALQDLTLTFIS